MAVISKWGNSLAVRLPRTVADQLGLHDGSEVKMSVEGGRLVIQHPRRKRVRLEDLLKDIDPKKQHPMIDWGKDVGSEIIE